MKQLTYTKKETLQWWDVAEPTLQSPKEALVRPFVAARCDADVIPLFKNVTKAMKAATALHYLDPLTLDVLGNNPFKGPYPIGHECVAEVIGIGDEVKNVSVGDMVIVPWNISCGSCPHCKIRLTSKCTASGDTVFSAYGFGEAFGPWGGMVSDLLRVPFADSMLVEVPEGIDPVNLASASDNISDAWRTVAPQLKQRPEAPVLIVGGGARSIALYAAAIAVALGSSTVDYVDHSRTRLEIAASVGANPVEVPAKSAWFRQNAPKNSGRYPISVDASANIASLVYAIRSLSPGGTCTSVGFYFQKRVPIPLWHMFVNSSTLITGASNPRADLPDVLNLIREGTFQPEKVTTLLADWNDAADAFLQRSTKVVVARAPLNLESSET